MDDRAVLQITKAGAYYYADVDEFEYGTKHIEKFIEKCIKMIRRLAAGDYQCEPRFNQMNNAVKLVLGSGCVEIYKCGKDFPTGTGLAECGDYCSLLAKGQLRKAEGCTYWEPVRELKPLADVCTELGVEVERG